MQPADASPAAQTGPDAIAVPPPRPAPEVESVPRRDDIAPDGTEHAAEDSAGRRADDSADTHAEGGAGTRTEGGAGTHADGLGEREREILAFERQWWRHAGAKEQAIRDRFGLSATRYYQLLNALLDNPAALAADPVLVGRLRRLRASRTRDRRR